jgi:hypothetical protein
MAEVESPLIRESSPMVMVSWASFWGAFWGSCWLDMAASAFVAGNLNVNLG